MNKTLFILTISLVFIYACSSPSTTVAEKAFHVYGNCEKCKARIEKAANLKGVAQGNWHIDSKLFTCKLDTVLTSTEEVLKAIAAVGHDNESFPANDYAYDKLPTCCQYERVEHVK